MTIPGPDDFGGLLEGLGRIQRQLEDAEAAAASKEVVGSAGGGAVRIHVQGDFAFTAVEIEPSLLAAGDATLLEDLVLAALHDTTTQLAAARNSAMGSVVSEAFGSLFGAVEVDGEVEGDNEDNDDNGGYEPPAGELPPMRG